MFKVLLLVSAFALTANCFNMDESERLIRQYFSVPLGSSSSSSSGGLSSSGGSPAPAGDSTTAATTVASGPVCDPICAGPPSDTAPTDLTKCPPDAKVCFKADGTTAHDPPCTGAACTPAVAPTPAPPGGASSTSSGGTLSFYPLFQVSSGGINGTGY